MVCVCGLHIMCQPWMVYHFSCRTPSHMLLVLLCGKSPSDGCVLALLLFPCIWDLRLGRNVSQFEAKNKRVRVFLLSPSISALVRAMQVRIVDPGRTHTYPPTRHSTICDRCLSLSLVLSVSVCRVLGLLVYVCVLVRVFACV